MYCSKCGVKCDDTFSYCPKCGSDLSVSKSYANITSQDVHITDSKPVSINNNESSIGNSNIGCMSLLWMLFIVKLLYGILFTWFSSEISSNYKFKHLEDTIAVIFVLIIAYGIKYVINIFKKNTQTNHISTNSNLISPTASDSNSSPFNDIIIDSTNNASIRPAGQSYLTGLTYLHGNNNQSDYHKAIYHFTIGSDNNELDSIIKLLEIYSDHNSKYFSAEKANSLLVKALSHKQHDANSKFVIEKTIRSLKQK